MPGWNVVCPPHCRKPREKQRELFVHHDVSSNRYRVNWRLGEGKATRPEWCLAEPNPGDESPTKPLRSLTCGVLERGQLSPWSESVGAGWDHRNEDAAWQAIDLESDWEDMASDSPRILGNDSKPPNTRPFRPYPSGPNNCKISGKVGDT